MYRRGFSLVELLIVIAVVALLLAVLLPSLGRARDLARLASCAARLRDIGTAVESYAAVHDRRLPPFAFSSMLSPSLPASGHWGGADQVADPAVFGRGNAGMDYVNLWALTPGEFTDASTFVCPGAPAELAGGDASYFPHTRRFSTYCLRYPPSEGPFTAAPITWNRYGMGIYVLQAGGQDSPVITAPPAIRGERVPVVRLDRVYSLLPEVGGEYDPASDVLLADTFWHRGVDQPAPDRTGVAGYRRRADWCHGRQFNALHGDGSVGSATDDGTIAEAVAGSPSGDYDAPAAERVWRLLDSRGG